MMRDDFPQGVLSWDLFSYDPVSGTFGLSGNPSKPNFRPDSASHWSYEVARFAIEIDDIGRNTIDRNVAISRLVAFVETHARGGFRVTGLQVEDICAGRPMRPTRPNP